MKSVKEVIPVRHLGQLRKADESLKVLALRASTQGRRALAGSISDALLAQITEQIKDAEVKNFDLTRMIIASGAQQSWPSPYNDPESALFVAQDEMPKIYDALQLCDVIVVATDVTWNLPNRHLVGMAERLSAFKVGMDSGQVKLGPKMVCVIASSQDGGANEVAALIAQMWARLGFTVPGHCVITAAEGSGNKDDLSATVEQASMALIDAAMAFRR